MGCTALMGLISLAKRAMRLLESGLST
jgi:hypothetical protein